jgi:prophage regulatory protein
LLEVKRLALAPSPFVDKRFCDGDLARSAKDLSYLFPFLPYRTKRLHLSAGFSSSRSTGGFFSQYKFGRRSKNAKENTMNGLPANAIAASKLPTTKFYLPETGFVRLKNIIAPNGPIPVSKSTWWAGVKSRRFPQPIKLGPKITAWRVKDIRALIENPERRLDS